LLAVLAALPVLLVPAASAHAAPSPQELERQIDTEWNKLEPIIEQYNMVHGQLKANRAKSAALQTRLQPLQLEVDLAMSRIGDMAAQMYKGGRMSALSAMLVTGSPTTLADQLSLLDRIAQDQREQVSGAAALRDRYAADKKVVDDLIATQAQQDAFLAAQKKEIEARMAGLQRLRQQAYGTTGAQGALRTGPCPAEYYPTPGGKAAQKACSLIGRPYEWGSAGPSTFDCSGLTLVAWASAGVTLRHYTRWQWEDHKPVSRSQLQPGDLVFYYSDLHHMGMYVGGGMIVHAPTTGDFVRMRKLDNGMPIAGFRRPGN
jgi:cell wall-associated NlpC family hydrolase